MDNISWKKTIVFYCMDAVGHINPILSIAKELRRRNYRAILLTTLPMKDSKSLTDKGLEVDCCIKKDADLEQKEEKGDITSIVNTHMSIFKQGPEVSSKAVYSVDGVAGKYLDNVIENHDIIEAKLRDMKPDLIVVDHVVGVPCTTYVAERWVRFYSAFPSGLLTYYNDNFVASFGFRLEEMSLAKKKQFRDDRKELLQKNKTFWEEKRANDSKLWSCDIEIAPTSPFLNFYLGPNELSYDNEPTLKQLPKVWFKLEHTIDALDEEKSAIQRFKLPDVLQNKPGKLIYFSMGTLASSDADLVNRLLAMLEKSPNRFIISLGKMHEHIKLFSNMWGAKFLDQKAVLPQVDLFITHGGHNSIIEAFYYGVSGLIVLPVFADQFDAAQRIEDCGFGVRLNPFDCKEEELLKSIDSLLVDETVKRRMSAASARLRSIKYHELAADELEKLLTH